MAPVVTKFLTMIKLDIFREGNIDNYKYVAYANMREWIQSRNVPHTFGWVDSGKFLPNYIMLLEEDAAIFKLMFLDYV